MRGLVLIASLILATALCAPACSQPGGQYAFNIPKTNPEAFVAWRKILPPELRSQQWIFQLEGTASPYTTVTVNGRRHLYGSFCKPHDCGMNHIAFLMAEDGSRATGLYVVGLDLDAHEIFLGNPTSQEKVLLRAMAE